MSKKSLFEKGWQDNILFIDKNNPLNRPQLFKEIIKYCEQVG
jgi:hypothetical protein